MNRLISIVVPVYNKRPYLMECFESLRKQTYPEFEVLLVDDGSTDGSAEFAEYYCKKNKRFRFFHQANAGQNEARKTGVDAANGDWIIFVDADDFVAPRMCEIFMKSMEETHADFVVAGSQLVNGDKFLDVQQPPAGIYRGIERLKNGYTEKDSLLLCTKLAASLCVILFRKEQIKRALETYDIDIRVCEDTACIWQMMIQAERISYIPDILYFCRVVLGSASRSHEYKHGVFPRMMSQFVSYMDAQFLKAGLHPDDYPALDAMALMMMLYQGYEYFDDFHGIFPYFEGECPNKVKVYGAGRFGEEFYNKEKERLNIVGWYDRAFESCRARGLNVDSPENMKIEENDCIIIAIWRDSTAQEVAKELARVAPQGAKIIAISKDMIDSAYTMRKMKELRKLDS